MKLVHFTPNFAPHFEGGTERVVRAHARELGRLGHEVRVVAGTEEPHRGADRLRDTVDGIEVVHLPRQSDEGYDVELERPRLVALAREEARGADVAHVHHWSGNGMSLVRALSRETPVVVTLHDHFTSCVRFFRTSPDPAIVCPPRGELAPCARCLAPDLPPERAAAGVHAALERRVRAFDAELAAARALLAPSRTHARAVEELCGLRRGAVRALPHGLCSRIERPLRAPGSVWDGSRPLRVLHLGHRTAAKGSLELVSALATLPAGSVELHLAGREVEAGFDAALARTAGRLALHHHGAYAPEDLAGMVGDCDLVALPSRARESYGLVLDEAFALGMPAWVSDRGALHERVGSAGRVLPALNPAAWASAFRELLDNPDLHARERAAVPKDIPTAADAARELDLLYRNLSPIP